MTADAHLYTSEFYVAAIESVLQAWATPNNIDQGQHRHSTLVPFPDCLSHALTTSSKSGSGRQRTAAEEAAVTPSFTPENPVTPR